MTKSGPFADAHGVTGYNPNLTNNPHCCSVDGKSTRFRAQVVYGPNSPNPLWESTQNFTDEETLTITGICWQSHMFTGEQGRNASNSPTSRRRKSSPRV